MGVPGIKERGENSQSQENAGRPDFIAKSSDLHTSHFFFHRCHCVFGVVGLPLALVHWVWQLARRRRVPNSDASGSRASKELTSTVQLELVVIGD